MKSAAQFVLSAVRDFQILLSVMVHVHGVPFRKKIQIDKAEKCHPRFDRSCWKEESGESPTHGKSVAHVSQAGFKFQMGCIFAYQLMSFCIPRPKTVYRHFVARSRRPISKSTPRQLSFSLMTLAKHGELQPSGAYHYCNKFPSDQSKVVSSILRALSML
jgi:hypothetical protein